MQKFETQCEQWMIYYCNLKDGNQDRLNAMINKCSLDKKHVDKLENVKRAGKFLNDEGNSEEDNLDFLPYRW